MKKIPFLLFVLFCALLAYAVAPFGLLPGVEEQREGSYGNLLRQIVQDHKVCVEVVNRLNGDDPRLYFKMVEQGYNKWFSHTLQAIEKTGRQEEFADLIPVLKQGVHVQQVGVDCSQADLRVYVMSLAGVFMNCESKAAACVTLDTDPVFMYFHPFKGIQKWLVGSNQDLISHELGHTLGMADQYKYGRINAHEVYHTPDTQKSIMDSAKPSTQFGCDDVDGFINLLDVAVFNNRRGGQDGWRSFCKKRNYSYVAGRPVVNARYAVDLLSNPKVGPRLTVYDKKGNWVRQQQYGFEPVDKPYDLLTSFKPIQTEKDKQGRVIYQKNARGEERFCSYTYERSSCIVVKGDKILYSYLELLKRKFRVAEIQYSYGRDIPSAFISFKQTGKTGQVIFGAGNERNVYNVSDKGYLSAVESESQGWKNVRAMSALGNNLKHQAEQQRKKAIDAYVQTVFDMYLK